MEISQHMVMLVHVSLTNASAKKNILQTKGYSKEKEKENRRPIFAIAI